MRSEISHAAAGGGNDNEPLFPATQVSGWSFAFHSATVRAGSARTNSVVMACVIEDAGTYLEALAS